MKGRGLHVSLVFVAVAMLAIPASAGASGKSAKGLTLSLIGLKGSNGYKLEVFSYREGSASAIAAITAKRGDLSASYETKSKGGVGIHADLGPVGKIDLRFQRRKREVEKAGKNCRIIDETGVFRGSLEFEGEGGYTRASRRSARGEVLRLPNGFCFLDDLKAPWADFFDTTTLSARARTANGSIEVEASQPTHGKRPVVTASLLEKVGAVKIKRSATTVMDEHALVIGAGKPPRSATLKASKPFSGSAEFQHPVGSPPSWTGSLSVSLPGAPGVALAGPDFVARICANQGLFTTCRAKLPPPETRPEPELLAQALRQLAGPRPPAR